MHFWKNITAIRQKRKTQRFSFIPDGFTPVDPDQVLKQSRARAVRRQGGFWGPDVNVNGGNIYMDMMVTSIAHDEDDDDGSESQEGEIQKVVVL